MIAASQVLTIEGTKLTYGGYANHTVIENFSKGNHWIGLRIKDNKSLVMIIPIDPSLEELENEKRFVGYIDNMEDFKTILRILNI